MRDSRATQWGTFARPSSPKITFDPTEDLLEGNSTRRTGIIAKRRRGDRDNSRKGWAKGTQNRRTRAVSEKDGSGGTSRKGVVALLTRGLGTEGNPGREQRPPRRRGRDWAQNGANFDSGMSRDLRSQTRRRSPPGSKNRDHIVERDPLDRPRGSRDVLILLFIIKKRLISAYVQTLDVCDFSSSCTLWFSPAACDVFQRHVLLFEGF
ncbi:hypothetical protein GUJ93_ZPchr0013g35463 [Zizania palustris]|uniref:Uncharacterized protein n=1 Tax=Zizania palustris TaxID=103762 RepID=A0A8J5WS53_ZIZPA|nr:hypothetical protein GUJ93_ZPchr0013g35463 [Zizania palustris]